MGNSLRQFLGPMGRWRLRLRQRGIRDAGVAFLRCDWIPLDSRSRIHGGMMARRLSAIREAEVIRNLRRSFRKHRRAGNSVRVASRLAKEDMKAKYGDSPDWERILELVLKILTLIAGFV